MSGERSSERSPERSPAGSGNGASGSSASIELAEFEFIKRQAPALSALERLRTEAGRRVAERCGLFSVPAILGYDDAAGQIRFERLRGLVSFKETIGRADDPAALARRVGSALAAIHDQLEAPPSPQTLSGETLGVSFRSDPIPLHGDFGPGNILVEPGTLEIAIVDWSSPLWIGQEITAGPASLDLAVFLISLFELRPFDPTGLENPAAVAQGFLDAYAEACSRGLDLEDLRTGTRALQTLYLKKMLPLKGVIGTVAGLPYAYALRRFIGHFCTNRSTQ